MVAALTRVFGVHNLALAEDVVQDAFCRAVEVWKFRGVPENPSAWLMATAKHRLRRPQHEMHIWMAIANSGTTQFNYEVSRRRSSRNATTEKLEGKTESAPKRE